MTNTKLQNLKAVTPVIIIVMMLLSIEILAEARHFLRCYDTIFFGKRECARASIDTESASLTPDSFGPTKLWPYRSKVPKSKENPVNPLYDPAVSNLVWISSASHAEHQRMPAAVVFPNNICRKLSEKWEPCLVVNGSRAGFTIDSNIGLLEDAEFTEAIDIAILYQMAMFISLQQTQPAIQFDNKLIRSDNKQSPRKTLSASMTTLFQRTSLYLHLSEYIGSTIKLAAFRKNTLPDAEFEWQMELERFIEYCLVKGMKPVLTTFAAAYDSTNIESAPVSLLRTLVRQNETLSPKGFVDTIATLNQTIERVASERNVALIDLAKVLDGRPELFVDMVHFNAHGHELVARTLVVGLENILP